MTTRTVTATGARSTFDNWTWVFGLFGAGNILNALWMLADPPGWYRDLPAAVPDFGPLNEHFVRDIGAAFMTSGVALLWAAFVPALRVPMLAIASLFYVLHALVHVWDTSRGLVGSEHWMIDLPGVYLPALLLMTLLAVLMRRQAAR
jgi:hypothetical protein